MADSSTLVDRVKIFVESSGTGPFQLGNAVPAFRGSEALTDGLTYSYAVESGSDYEVGQGVYVLAVDQLLRAPTLSSAGGAPVAFPANVTINFTALAADLTAGLAGTGTVTSIQGSGGTTGMTLTGGPITGAGTLTLGGTLGLANGGTGGTDGPTARTGIGLGNVDNTSDADKPLSTAVQTALDLKASLAALAASTGATLIGSTDGSVQAYLNGLPKISVNILDAGGFLNGVGNDGAALQTVVTSLTRGVIDLPGFESNLTTSIICKSDQLFDFGRSFFNLTPSGAFSFGLGDTGGTQITDVKFRDGYYELHGANKVAWKVRNAGGITWDDVNLRMWDSGQIGIHAIGNLSPNGPYYGVTRGLRVYGNATPGSGQIAIQLDHSGDVGAFGVNRWDMHLKQIAAVDFGLRINGAQGFTSTRASFEACYDTAIQLGVFGGGVNPGFHNGTATSATSDGTIIDTSLIGETLFTAGAVKITGGPNAGLSFPVESVNLSTGLIVLRGIPPFTVAVGNSYTYYELRAQATLPLVEIETAGVGVEFGPHAADCRVNFGFITDAPTIFTRAIEDVNNTVARTLTPVTFTVTANMAAGNSSVWLDPAHVASTRGGFELLQSGWIDAVSAVDKVLNTGRAGTLKLVPYVNGVAQPDDLCPILTDVASVRGRRVRTSLAPNQLIRQGQSIKVLAEGTGMAAGSWPEVTIWIGSY